jgi:hypothetical protein
MTAAPLKLAERDDIYRLVLYFRGHMTAAPLKRMLVVSVGVGAALPRIAEPAVPAHSLPSH